MELKENFGIKENFGFFRNLRKILEFKIFSEFKENLEFKDFFRNLREFWNLRIFRNLRKFWILRIFFGIYGTFWNLILRKILCIEAKLWNEGFLWKFVDFKVFPSGFCMEILALNCGLETWSGSKSLKLTQKKISGGQKPLSS